MAELAAPKSSPAVVTLQERLASGNLTVAEVCALAGRSRTGFYEDLKAGRVSIRKAGRKTLVPGPVARRYIAGETGEA
jgi:ribosomal protein S14